MKTVTSIAPISTSTATASAPSERSARLLLLPARGRPEAGRGPRGTVDQWIAIHSELMIERAVLLPGFVTQSMNFAASPFGTPLVTNQKLRTPPYWPDFALRSVQGMP